MNDEEMQNTFPGKYFWIVLCLLFTHHKLVGSIDWSWWWVMAPVWINFVIVTIFLAIHRAIKRREQS